MITTRQKIKNLRAALRNAREMANRFPFGSAEWEARMVQIRRYCEMITELTAPAEYKSREGDVFSVNP